MKKLIVCGCSYSADSSKPELKGTGYGHQLAQRLGWDVQILARQGCSNGGIRIQIDEVIRQRPAFAIIAPTFHDRMEIPAKAAPYDFKKNQEGPLGWDNFFEKHLRKSHRNGYAPAAGINNVNYGNNPYRMICETMFTLAENIKNEYRSVRLDDGTTKAMKEYINYLYDSDWKLQKDRWMMRDGIMQLYYANIPFLLVANNLWNVDTVRQEMPAVLPDRYMTLRQEHTPAHATTIYPIKGDNFKNDPGYHGDPESQQYLADIYYQIITKEFGIAP
jgi:hypothetical protein